MSTDHWWESFLESPTLECKIQDYDDDLECPCAGTPECEHRWACLSDEEQNKLLNDWFDDALSDWYDDAPSDWCEEF